MLALGIDLGGSHASAALVSEAGIVAQRVIPVAVLRFRDLLPPIEAMIASLFDTAGAGQWQCAGMVFGFPGAVDAEASRVIATNEKFDDAKAFDFADWARQRFDWPMVLENDVRLALVGEHACGAAKGAENAVMMSIGTGIGTAVLLDGKPLRGRRNQAGSLGGHIPVRLDGRRCSCGGRGCAESEASTWALPLVCREWPGFAQSQLAQSDAIDFRVLFDAMDAGDPFAREVFEHCIDIWATLAVALTHAYSPEIVVVGGGVLARAHDIVPRLAERLGQEAWSPAGPVIVSPSALGPAAALHATIPILQEFASS